MCDFSGKLIAWLDGELPADEAAEVAQHLRLCADCRDDLSVYERLTGALDAYCDAAMAASAPRRTHYGRPILLGAGAAAAAALIALVLTLPLVRNAQRPPAPTRAPAEVRAIPVAETAQAPAVPVKPLRRPRPAAPKENQDTRWPVSEPAIQITIPAEEVFPPGAVPEGVSFVADVHVGAGGSLQQFLVWP